MNLIPLTEKQRADMKVILNWVETRPASFKQFYSKNDRIQNKKPLALVKGILQIAVSFGRIRPENVGIINGVYVACKESQGIIIMQRVKGDKLK